MIHIPGKIPIHISPFFFLLAFFIGFIYAFSAGIAMIFLWVIAIFISVLIHEYGHALTAYAFKQKVEIHLIGFGGMTTRKGKKTAPWQDFLITLNGCLAGLAFCGLMFLLQKQFQHILPRSINYFLSILIWINLFWSFINLFPIHPLDGSQLVRIILESFLGILGIRIAALISVLFSVFIALLFIYHKALLGAIIFLFLAFESLRYLKVTFNLTPEDRNKKIQSLFEKGAHAYNTLQWEEAEKYFKEILHLSHGGILYVSAATYLGLIYYERQQYAQALSVLEPIKNQLDTDSLPFLHELYYKEKQWKQAIALGNQLSKISPNPKMSLINAYCHAHLDEPQLAIEWLKTALQEGLSNPQEIFENEEFENLQDNEEFNNLKKQYE